MHSTKRCSFKQDHRHKYSRIPDLRMGSDQAVFSFLSDDEDKCAFDVTVKIRHSFKTVELQRKFVEKMYST